MTKEAVHGEFCWNELISKDVAKSASFYKSLFGWNTTEHDMGYTKYTMFMNGDKPACGMMQMPAEKPADIPSHWVSYINVTSIDDTIATATGLGASVIMPKTKVEGFGSFAVLKDTAGAHFSLWEVEKK